MKAIAAAAGVSRQLVDFHYENRAGLLVGMARHQDRRSGFIDRVAGDPRAAAVESLEALARVVRLHPRDSPGRPRARGGAETGDEGSAPGAIGSTTSGGHSGSRWSGSPPTAGSPRAGRDTATDWIWPAQLASYEHLVEVRGWTREQFAERTTAAALGAVLAGR